jgi:hypothetical protein
MQFFLFFWLCTRLLGQVVLSFNQSWAVLYFYEDHGVPFFKKQFGLHIASQYQQQQ